MLEKKETKRMNTLKLSSSRSSTIPCRFAERECRSNLLTDLFSPNFNLTGPRSVAVYPAKNTVIDRFIQNIFSHLKKLTGKDYGRCS